MQKTTFNLILLNSIFMIGLVMSNLFGEIGRAHV